MATRHLDWRQGRRRRSSSALAARRERAVRRGCVRPLPAGRRLIAVPIGIYDRAKVVLRALALHCRLNQATGEGFHFAAHAALGARDYLGAEGVREALAVNRAAALARHHWPPA
eukprot:10021636-Alexandrium_andersonii.AAC.1